MNTREVKCRIRRYRNLVTVEFYKVDMHLEICLFSKNFHRTWAWHEPNESTWKKARAWAQEQIRLLCQYQSDGEFDAREFTAQDMKEFAAKVALTKPKDRKRTMAEELEAFRQEDMKR